MSLCRAVLLLLLTTLLFGCFGGKEEPPPVAAAAPPQAPPPIPPTRVELRIEALADVNPSGHGAAAPVVVRVYELKGLSGFNGADFFALYDKDQASMGGDLLGKRELFLRPGEKQTLQIQPTEGTAYLAALAAFRNLESARWRVSAPIPAHQTSVFELRLSRTQMTMTALPVPQAPVPAQTKPVPGAAPVPAAPAAALPSVPVPEVPAVSVPSVPVPEVPAVSVPSVPSVSVPTAPSVPVPTVPSVTVPTIPSATVPQVTVP